MYRLYDVTRIDIEGLKSATCVLRSVTKDFFARVKVTGRITFICDKISYMYRCNIRIEKISYNSNVLLSYSFDLCLFVAIKIVLHFLKINKKIIKSFLLVSLHIIRLSSPTPSSIDTSRCLSTVIGAAIYILHECSKAARKFISTFILLNKDCTFVIG